jgi:hypothetical protein
MVMKSARLIFACATVAYATGVSGASVPYKETMQFGVRAKQPVVYARVTTHGFGVQYVRDPDGPGVGGLVGAAAGGLLGEVVGSAFDRAANAGPTNLAQVDAEKLGPLLDRARAQRELELALAQKLDALPLFGTSVVVRTLEPDVDPRAADLNADPVLVIEVHASLTLSYRSLQVTALAAEYSRDAFAANPRTSQHGRVYRNRFDYVSDLAPVTPMKSQDQIDAELDAVKDKYRGRRLSKQEQMKKNQEMKDVLEAASFERWREPLLAEWGAGNGAKLQDALAVGIEGVVGLLAQDLLDFSEVAASANDPIEWKTLKDVGVGRYTQIFVGGPLAGALISEPSGSSIEYCMGTAFSKAYPADSAPQLCPGQGE